MTEEIGLFPLGIVLLPGERIPLHIFEDRYKELIEECLAADRPFGMVLSDAEGVRSIGTKAFVVELLERLPDGRLNVVVEGRDRFLLQRATEGRSFLTADVEALEDDEPEADPDALAACIEAYEGLAEAAGSAPAPVDQQGDSPAFQIAGRIEFSPELKQDLLGMRSETRRLERLTELLDQAVEVARLRRKASDLASGNGHVTPD